MYFHGDVPDEFRSFVARRGQLLRLVSLSDVAGSNRSRQTKHLAILNVTQSAFGNREYVAKFQSRAACPARCLRKLFSNRSNSLFSVQPVTECGEAAARDAGDHVHLVEQPGLPAAADRVSAML